MHHRWRFPHAEVAISVTGIAGPSGATDTKPLGLVYLGLCRSRHAPSHRRFVFAGDRPAVRAAALAAAFELLFGEVPAAKP